MKVAVIGSRNLSIENLENYLPKNTTEIVSGGAKGIDTCARNYALEHNLLLKEFLPNYSEFGRAAPIRRNIEIIAYADYVLAFWDGKSKGTEFVIKQCKKKDVICDVIMI
ncbi:DNA-processing protein DprA [Chakrabartyella piscis]|uniref:DNA-processing protein DprA n=1 Tax=Chakrabartyella piscis TaxID=2918914 RepID=UPI0029584925|nr:DNA-processing protein DprA [Chakrabartyella piscis]